MASALGKTPARGRQTDSVPTLGTATTTTAMQGVAVSAKLHEEPGVQLLLQLRYLNPISPDPRPEPRVSPQPASCSLWRLKADSCRPFCGLSVPRLFALGPRFLLVWSTWAASFTGKINLWFAPDFVFQPPDVMTYRGSLSTRLVQKLPWVRYGNRRGGWHKACIGKS